MTLWFIHAKSSCSCNEAEWHTSAAYYQLSYCHRVCADNSLVLQRHGSASACAIINVLFQAFFEPCNSIDMPFWVPLRTYGCLDIACEQHVVELRSATEMTNKPVFCLQPR